MEDFKKFKIMELIHKIGLFLFLLTSTIVLGQTPGFNYQALILNNEEIQIPGTDVTQNNIPLDLEDVTLRFTITNEAGIEYTEEHTITTDENGLVSIIVGEGTPINFTFGNINWDGKLKYLNVELDILSNNEGFVFLDTQKILFIPHQNNGNDGTIKIVNSLRELTPPYDKGELIWITNFGANGNPTLLIWNETNWVPVNEDYDDDNELGLIVVENDIARSTKFTTPAIGDQVWNNTLKCIQVYDGSNWVSLTTEALNVLHKDGNTVKLGGHLIEPTEITTDETNTLAIKGLQESVNKEDLILVVDKNTGVLKHKSLLLTSKKTQVIINATEGQVEFCLPLSFANKENIDVYRNGIRINFTTVDNLTIKLEPEAMCFKNDKIRIVQLF